MKGALLCRPSQNYNKTARSTSKAAAFCFSIHVTLGAVTIFKGAASAAPYFRPIQPKSVISIMMITTLVFVQMSLRFEGAMGFHCN